MPSETPAPFLDWVKEFPGAVTVCDHRGVILAMNDRSAQTFGKDGGSELVGRSLLDCHPEPARSKLLALLASHQSNIYTIEKNGVKKLIHQSPWYHQGRFAGLVELSLELPSDLPHFIRD